MNISVSYEEIRSRIKEIPISEIIGHYISLTRHGDNHIGKCPFHNDSRPSLSVNDKKGIYKCFACGKAGDAITFVERFCSLKFSEAIQEIGKFLGISVENIFSRGKDRDIKTLWTLSLLKSINNFYLKNTTSKIFKDFLYDRKIAPEIAKKFSLSYAANENLIIERLTEICSMGVSELKKDLTKNGHDNEKISELLNQNKILFKLSSSLKLLWEIGAIQEGLKDRFNNSKHFDTFRNRIIFPIQNLNNEIVAFGSRSLDKANRAKYLNSKESFIFNKRNILYGLNFSKQKIKEKDQIILVEGYMDLITLHKCGFENSVALMGIALNEKMINTIKYLTKNVYLALDADDAGMRAMERINHDLMANSIMPKYIDFSPYKDPDDFLNKNINDGSAELTKKIDNGVPFLDRMISEIIPSEDKLPELTDQKLKILDQIFLLLSPLKDDLRAHERIVVAGNKLKLKSSSDHLIEIYRKFLLSTIAKKKDQDKTRDKNEKNEKCRSINSDKRRDKSSKQQKQISDEESLTRLEKALIKELILHPECLQHGNLPEILKYVEKEDVAKLILWLKKLYYEITEAEYQTTIIGHLSRGDFNLEFKEYVSNVLFQYRPKKDKLEQKNIDKSLLDIKTIFEKKWLMKKRRSLLEEQKKCETQEEFKIVANELSTIDKGINSLNFNTY
ncbi:MAG: DNA primase [Oligoflexia bacterium]|nr:DNA primase [Oligoflexia bacterium]